MRQSIDMNRARVFVGALLTLGFCSAFGQLPVSGQWNKQNYVNWRTLRSGSNSRYTTPQMIVLGTEGEFFNYWQRATGSPGETAPTQNVDWDKQLLVAIHLGNRATTGYDVKVKGVVKDGTVDVIRAVEETPMKGQVVAKTVTSPWVIIEVDRDANDFRIEWSTAESHPQIILGPGGSYIGPGDRDGAGWVPLANQADWGTVRAGTECNIREQEVVVMNSEFDFINYYRRAFDGAVPASQNDFLRYRLIAIHLGERRTGGYTVSVRNVIKDGGRAIVRAVEQTPIPGMAVSHRATSPWIVIRVQRDLFDISLDLQVEQIKKGIAIVGGDGG
jgi:hypothetical protein